MAEQFGKPSWQWCDGYWSEPGMLSMWLTAASASVLAAVNVNDFHRERGLPDPGALLIPEGNSGSSPGLESAGEEIVEDFNIVNDRGWV